MITLVKDKRLTFTIKRKYLKISKKKRKTTKWEKKKKNRCKQVMYKMPKAHQHAVTLPLANACPLAMFHSS